MNDGENKEKKKGEKNQIVYQIALHSLNIWSRMNEI